VLAVLYSNRWGHGGNNNNGGSGGDGGNNSNNSNSNDNFLEGYVFATSGYLGNTPTADSSSMMGVVAKSIQHYGGGVCAQYDAGRVTHVVLETLGQPGTSDEQLYALAMKDEKRVVSWVWVEACIKERDVLTIDDSPLYVPPPTLDGLPDMKGVRVCVTGYKGYRRAALIAVVNLLGVEHMRVLDRTSTHLVCFEFEGAKWAKANQTKVQRIVSHRWLEECPRQWKRLPEEPFTTRSSKEEDERVVSAIRGLLTEVPDSEDDENDFLMNINNNAGVCIHRSAALCGYVLDWLRTGSVAGVPETAAVRRVCCKRRMYLASADSSTLSRAGGTARWLPAWKIARSSTPRTTCASSSRCPPPPRRLTCRP
jgi:hypothetical protein